jgi:hypothetical protein
VKVILNPDLFAAPVQSTRLVAFIHYAIDDRHRIEFEPTHPTVAGWVERQARDLQEEIALALEFSTQAEAREPAHTVVEVIRTGATDFNRNPIQLNVHTAQGFLERPFVVLLEDQVSDLGFISCMMSSEERHFFTRRIESGFVQVDHGGGLGAMTRRVTEAARDPASTHKLWLMFDSDAMQPGKPSRQSENLRSAAAKLPHHQLRRRYMESYLPHKALHLWATNPARARVRRDRLARLQSFIDMGEQQRNHYNMKDGFDGDAARTDASAGTLYDNVHPAEKLVLAKGFGSDIGDLFRTNHVVELDLRRSAGWEEMRPAIRNLVERVR